MDELAEQFQRFEVVDHELKSMLYELPGGFDLDFFVYQVADTIMDEERAWDMPFVQIIKRMKFDSFTEWVRRSKQK